MSGKYDKIVSNCMNEFYKPIFKFIMNIYMIETFKDFNSQIIWNFVLDLNNFIQVSLYGWVSLDDISQMSNMAAISQHAGLLGNWPGALYELL